ncbi:hypothetical protein BK138_32290 [Paenibacillus rhizosphaerae]|uniref:Uncharacterized protein n=1 Tax=Paenibacillus rhizosphaerae TaxID=297318 RepID=A0A1R1E662_9BACL|nr:hypothetical protein [Paenibacillus rhizosphaerae]OMF47314.1 hypothetical protein BK138_32290 [Paenibacillus rhizosphaerae]
MKKYQLIRSELLTMQNKSNIKGLISSIFSFPLRSSFAFIQVDLPEYDVLRAEVFLEDLADILEEESQLTIIDLLALLLQDFLYVASTTAKLEILKDSLLEKRKHYLSKTEQIEEYIEVSPGHASLQIRDKERRIRYYTLELTIPRKTALRLEIILYDLEQMFKTFQMGLDELISIVFLEFVHHLKAGNQKEIIKRFIQYFG